MEPRMLAWPELLFEGLPDLGLDDSMFRQIALEPSKKGQPCRVIGLDVGSSHTIVLEMLAIPRPTLVRYEYVRFKLHFCEKDLILIHTPKALFEATDIVKDRASYQSITGGRRLNFIL
jgi:hypothetical protein